jgi:hypothetical protein
MTFDLPSRRSCTAIQLVDQKEGWDDVCPSLNRRLRYRTCLSAGSCFELRRTEASISAASGKNAGYVVFMGSLNKR